MTTDDAALPEQRHVQINSGDGAFVGRDHHGDINIHHEIDPQTRVTLTKIGRIAPGLSHMLEQALRDGVISPETASQLSLATRSINEDVAGQISRASRSINEDVAGLLGHASKSINEDVAHQLSLAAEQLSSASTKIDLDKLDHLARRLEGLFDPQGGNNLHSVATRLEGSLSELSEATQRVGNLKGRSPETGKLEQVTMSLAEIARRVEAGYPAPAGGFARLGRAVALAWHRRPSWDRHIDRSRDLLVARRAVTALVAGLLASSTAAKYNNCSNPSRLQVPS